MSISLVTDDTLFVANPGGQRGFLDDYVHRHVALVGGWFSGKTWAGARKLADLHVWNAFDCGHRPTCVKGLIVAPNYSLARTINVPEMQAAFDAMGLSHRFKSDPRHYCLVLPDLGTRRNPSEILVRSAESPESITGFTVGHVWGDEAARWPVDPQDPLRDPFLQIAGRLRDPRARMLQAIFTFTHEGDETKVYRDFERDPRPGHALYRSGTFDNPHARSFGEEMTRQLTPELRAQYLEGQAIRFHGHAVYSAFDEASNTDGGLELVGGLPLQLAIDFNISPGMHAIVGQHFVDRDLLTAVYELHQPRMDVRQLMGAFAGLLDLAGRKWPEVQLYGDASGHSKWAGSGESCWDMVRQAMGQIGLPYRLKTPAANPPVADRVNAFNCALKDLAGVSHYKAHPRCQRLIRDFKQMKWDGGELNKTDREQSHASDADGYRVHWVRPIRRLVSGGQLGSK